MITGPLGRRIAIVDCINLLKKIAQRRPDVLPKIFAHRDVNWMKGGVLGDWMADTNGHLHMCETDFRALKNYGAPLKLVMDIEANGVSIHEFDYPKTAPVNVFADPNVVKQEQVSAIMGEWGSDVQHGRAEKAKTDAILSGKDETVH